MLKKFPKPQRSTLIQMAAILLWGVACMVFFQGYYRYHFFYQEQNQLFLLTSDYAATYLKHSAWLACLAGDFLTQFYYYLWLGPLILTLALLTVGDLARRALQRAGIPRWWAFGIAILLITFEAIFCFKTSFRLSSVIALGGGIVTFIIVSPLLRKGWMWQACTIIIGTALTYWLFGYGLWAFFILLLIDAICKSFKNKKEHKKVPKWTPLFRLIPLLAIPIIINLGRNCYYLKAEAALTYPGMGKFSMPDMALEKCFAVDNEYHFGNYAKVKEIVENDPHPTEPMLFFYNLVQAQEGQLPDQLLRFSPNQLGTFYAIGPNTPLITIINMNELYWALGDMTLAERAAMMTNVFAPNNRNVRMMKRLAECNLVSGDSLAANKYLRILQKTWAYKDWADRVVNQDARVMQDIHAKQKFINQADTIRLDDNLHRVMMELLDSNPNNIVALDYILCSDLLLKDITNFKRDYDRYCMDTGKPRVKPLYQQALMVWLAGTHAPQEEWEKYIHDAAMVERFALYNNSRGNPQFSDTYWYYFDTAKTPKP